MKLLRKWRLDTVLPWLLIICGIVGVLSSAIITIDKIKVLEDPTFNPICDINPVISCGSVMQSDQASAFGFPNMTIGLVVFPAIIVTGVVLLAGAQLKRWYWLGLQFGTMFGVGFVLWLFYQSVYNIQSLCPYCMVIWVVTITTFWYVTIYNLRRGHIKLPMQLAGIGTFVSRHHLDILLLWFLIMVALILNHFWYYYGPLLGF